MSVLSFKVTLSNRGVYSDEFLRINLDALSIDNNFLEAICRVLDPVSSNVSVEWKYCYFDNSFANLVLFPMRDILTLNTDGLLEVSIFIEIRNIRVPRTPVEEYFISIGLFNFFDNSLPIIMLNGVALPERLEEKTINIAS